MSEPCIVETSGATGPYIGPFDSPGEADDYAAEQGMDAGEYRVWILEPPEA